MSAMSTAIHRQNMNRRALVATAYAWVGKYGNSIIAFPITLLLVKGLTVQEYGTYSLFVNMLFVASIFTNLGTLGIIQRYLPEFLQRGEIANARKTIKITSAIRLGGGLLTISVLYFYTDTIFSLLNISPEYQNFAHLLCLLVLVAIEVQLLGDGVLGALLDQKAVTLGRFLSNICKLAAISIVFTNGYGLKGVVAGWVLSLAGLLIYYAVKVYAALFREPTGTTASLPKRRMYRYGAFYLTGVFGTFLYDIAIDNFVISYYLGAGEVGRYTFAVFIASLPGMPFPIRMMTPILVNLAIRRYSESNSHDVLQKMYTFFNKIIFFAVMPAVLGIYLLSDEIILHIFDTKYASTSAVVAIILICSLFRYFTYTFQTITKPLEIVHISLFQYGCSAVNLGLDLWLVPQMGIMGAALATGITLALNYFLIHLWVRRYIILRQDWVSLIKMTGNLLIMGIALLLLRGQITGLASLIAVILCSAGIYFLASYLNKTFTDAERALINSTVGKEVCVF